MAKSPARKGILALLDHGSELRTPAFQRSFAWEKEQVDDYWEDLVRALDHDGGPVDYFLGLVVVDENGHIQDGQQRLATTLLLVSALYNAGEGTKASPDHDPHLATEVAAVLSPALRSTPQAPLTIGTDDQLALIERAGIRTKALESVRRVGKAREELRKLVEVDLSKRPKANERLRRLKAWGDFLRVQAHVVVLDVPTREAHTIFETLNTRGVRLSNGDLVKSHLIARANDSAKAVKMWGAVTEALQDDKGNFEADLDSFLLHFYGSRYGRTVKRELFADLRPRIADPFTTLDELRESALLYHALAHPAHAMSFWSDFEPGTQQAVQLINGLGLKQLRYLLLAVLRDYQSTVDARHQRKHRSVAIKKIASWSVRGLVHHRTGGGDAEATYIEAAELLREGKITTLAGLRDHFVTRSMLIEADDLFQEEFRKYAFDSASNHTRARAILYALEFHSIASKSGVELKESLTVEHVLPISPAKGEWTQFDEDEQQVYAHRLGNLLLIDGPSGANEQLGNKEWVKKRELIRQWGPQSPLTREALAKQRWTKRIINQRHKRLAELATAAFAI